VTRFLAEVRVDVLVRAQPREDSVEQVLFDGALGFRRWPAQDLAHVVDEVRRRLEVLQHEVRRRGMPASKPVHRVLDHARAQPRWPHTGQRHLTDVFH